MIQVRRFGRPFRILITGRILEILVQGIQVVVTPVVVIPAGATPVVIPAEDILGAGIPGAAILEGNQTFKAMKSSRN